MNYKDMSAVELDRELKDSFQKEDAQVYVTLCILRAMNVNRSFAELGQPTLFQYLRDECKRSGGSAQRRIDAMFLMLDDKVIEEKIRTRELNFTNAALIGNTLRNLDATPEQKREIVLAAVGRMEPETREILSSHFPEIDLAVETKFAVPREYADMFEELKDDLAHENQLKTKLGIFLLLIKKEHAARKKKRTGPVKNGVAAEPKTNSSPEPKKRLSARAIARRITTFRLLLARANERCQHPKCNSKYGLERDHIIRLADGGTDTLDNLQILCKPHHRLKTLAEEKRAAIKK